MEVKEGFQCTLTDRGGSTSIQLQYCVEHNKYFITMDYHLVTKQRGADSALG